MALLYIHKITHIHLGGMKDERTNEGKRGK